MIEDMSSSPSGEDWVCGRLNLFGWVGTRKGLIMPVEIRWFVVGGDAKVPPGLERNTRVGDVVGHTVGMGIEVESRRGG